MDDTPESPNLTRRLRDIGNVYADMARNASTPEDRENHLADVEAIKQAMIGLARILEEKAARLTRVADAMSPTPNAGKIALAEIVAGLDGVTRGPWRSSASDVDFWVSQTGVSGEVVARRIGEENAAHIARCDPYTIRAIDAYVSALEKERDSLKAALLEYATELESLTYSEFEGRNGVPKSMLAPIIAARRAAGDAP